MHDHLTSAIAAASGAGVGIAAMNLGISYWMLAVAGGIIGIVHWFHAFSQSDPRWDKIRSMGEAFKSSLFGFVVMPAAIDLSYPVLTKYGIESVSTQIAIGSLTAFTSVELMAILLKYLNKLTKD